MVADKEMKAILAPVLAKLPDWRYHRGCLFHLPIGYYLRGVMFKPSQSSREAYQILRFVYPLFDFPQFIHMGWSMSYPVPGTRNRGWNAFHVYFASELIDVMENCIIPTVASIRTGSAFLNYLTENYTQHGWQETGKALAHVHMGDLKKARDYLIETEQALRAPHMERLLQPGAWGHNVVELLRLIETDPAAIPAHCEAVARASVKFNKLEKFWTPEPFVYDKDLLA